MIDKVIELLYFLIDILWMVVDWLRGGGIA
jgi:hypothetical protein